MVHLNIDTSLFGICALSMGRSDTVVVIAKLPMILQSNEIIYLLITKTIIYFLFICFFAICPAKTWV